MFVTSVLLFSLFITVKCNNISTEPSKNDVQLLGEYYENDIAYQSGEDVILKSKGGDKGMDIILKNGFLEVEMDLNNCVGKSIFCYNSTDKLDLLNEMCFPGFCGFIVEGFNGRKDDGTYDEVYDVVKTLSGYVSRGYISESCRSPSIIRMQYWKTYFCGGGNYDIMDEYSCAPKMDKGNKIHIYVIKIAEQCPIKILNAEIVDPTETTTNSSITTIGTTTEKTEDASLPWYFWVIIFIVLIILLIFVLVAVLYWNDLCCFAKKKKPLPPPSDLNYVGVPQPKPPAEQEPK
uniref:Uncharacterized protein n=1 Tax=Panagrolaimus sp. PS1159 TaxID=55785 RepID=A0AC35GQ57_9BILA